MTGFVRNLGFLPFHNLSSSVEQFLGWSSLDGLLMPMEDCPQLSSPISFVASLALSPLLLHTSAHFLSWDLQWVLLSIHFSWYLTYLVIIIQTLSTIPDLYFSYRICWYQQEDTGWKPWPSSCLDSQWLLSTMAGTVSWTLENIQLGHLWSNDFCSCCSLHLAWVLQMADK